jgi:hypothetical protein
MITEQKTGEIAKIDPKEFGLQETEAKSIEAAFMPKIVERDGLKPIYTALLTKEITKELCSEAKAVRLKLVKVRTGIADIHKTQKAFFLAAGRYVDAWKNKETEPVLQMEEKLSEIEDYYENIERERIAKLKVDRTAEIAKYQEAEAFIPGNLGELTDQVWQNYLLGVKTVYEQKIAAEKAAKEAEEKRIAEEKAEQERIRVENERLKKEAEIREAEIKKQQAKAEAEAKARAEKEAKERAEREAKEKAERESNEAALKAEREKAEKAQAELAAKAEAEAKAKAEAEARAEAELNKGDADKVLDLIRDLESLKTNFAFKSVKNKKMYASVGILLDKVVNYIKDGGQK